MIIIFSRELSTVYSWRLFKKTDSYMVTNFFRRKLVIIYQNGYVSIESRLKATYKLSRTNTIWKIKKKKEFFVVVFKS